MLFECASIDVSIVCLLPGQARRRSPSLVCEPSVLETRTHAGKSFSGCKLAPLQYHASYLVPLCRLTSIERIRDVVLALHCVIPALGFNLFQGCLPLFCPFDKTFAIENFLFVVDDFFKRLLPLFLGQLQFAEGWVGIDALLVELAPFARLSDTVFFLPCQLRARVQSQTHAYTQRE